MTLPSSWHTLPINQSTEPFEVGRETLFALRRREAKQVLFYIRLDDRGICIELPVGRRDDGELALELQVFPSAPPSRVKLRRGTPIPPARGEAFEPSFFLRASGQGGLHLDAIESTAGSCTPSAIMGSSDTEVCGELYLEIVECVTEHDKDDKDKGILILWPPKED